MPRRKTVKTEGWTVTNDNNPSFCGVGPCGAQFAHGEAFVTSKRAADWYDEHDGYTVEAATAATE